MSAAADWLVPDWPAPAGVKALFTTRAGGVSRPPFDSLNLGDHVRDESAAVAANRARLAAALDGARPVFLRQVHGTRVVMLAPDVPDGAEADGCIAAQAGLACTIMVADCLPVLLAHRGGGVVAAAHAGWRGLCAGVLEQAFEALARAVQGRQPGGPGTAVSRAAIARDTVVWLGPCIGPAAFEVGPEVRAAFVAAMPEAGRHFAPGAAGGDRYLAHLPALARQRLQAIGLRSLHGNDGSPPWCTVTQASRFFSHRRDAAILGSTGRMAACIWIG